MAKSLSGEPIQVDDAAKLLEDLCARLIAGPSATVVLEGWCRERGLASAPNLIALPVPGPERPLSAIQRERLELPRDGTVRYRRVRLSCAGRVLSEAENWYVPGRLTDSMNQLLDTSDVPFGRVVHGFAPSRRNLGLHVCPAAGSPGAADEHEPLFTIEALLLRRDGVPLCEVAEVYTGAVLARG